MTAASGSGSGLKTVPEDGVTALQPGQIRQAALPEGRAGSLRAWRGMYTQASISEAAGHEQQEQSHPGTLRPTSGSQQTRSRPSSAARASNASRSSSASGSTSTQGQQQHMQGGFQKPTVQAGLAERPGNSLAHKASASMQSSTLPKHGVKGSLLEVEGQEQAAALDLTDAER